MSRIGGWWRLWIAGAALLILITGAVALFTQDLEGDGVGSASCVSGTIRAGSRQETSWVANPKYFGTVADPRQRKLGEVVDEAAAWERLLKAKGIDSSDEYSLPISRNIQTFSCASWRGVSSSILYAALVAFAVALVGLVFRWIFRGFKK
ncbi:hypothetical protein [Stakelama tenebrarum]|uniref:Uncharacterized protein n=1 Tax=Stakelama tenebrarum TaxID=2711215 RepID=A0A6G6Y6D2_9SPHN|nr:hypothetical protein [Sphingosinithalassobacter tenebrarum]QIG80475.1 hypothetical protein G5C33_12255 [Sphingosinithalassobacter tenebrarum]